MENKIFIGCSGFSERSWKGFFYPEELLSKDYLNYYSKHLNAVEINSTFYRKPTLKTLEKWYNETEDDFKFFIKKITESYFLTNRLFAIFPLAFIEI